MKIHEYSLMKDVAASQLRPRVPQSLWQVSMLLSSTVSIVSLYRHAGHACVSSQWMSCTPVCHKKHVAGLAAEAVCFFFAAAITCR